MNKKIAILLPPALSIFMLVGCATPPPTVHAASTAGNERYWLKGDQVVRNDTASLLHYAAYVRGLSNAEREREVDRLRSAYAKDKSDFRRLQYVLALSTPAASATERRQALQLLDAVPEGRHDADVMALSSLVAGHLQAQVQVQRKAEDVERKLDGVEKKLDAVKDIERSLLQREKTKP